MAATDDDDITLVYTDPARDLEQMLSPLEELNANVRSGGLSVEEAQKHREALVSGWEAQPIRDHPYRVYSTSIAQRSGLLGRLIHGMYLPAEVPGSPEMRYKFSQVGPVGDGVTQFRFPNKDNGTVRAFSSFDPRPGKSSGTALPAIGILVEPQHAFSRIVFQPEVAYSWGHRADVPTAFGTANYAFSRGSLRLAAEKLNPQNGKYEFAWAKQIQLWQQTTGTGTGYGWQRGSGHYPGSDPGLFVFAGKGEHLRLSLQLVLEMSKEDHDPSAFTSGEAYIDAYVPVMWAVETAL